MGEIQDEGGTIIEDQAGESIEDEGGPSFLEVYQSECVGSGSQLA